MPIGAVEDDRAGQVPLACQLEDPVSYTHLDVYKRQVLARLQELVQAAAELPGKVRHKEQERGL